MRWGLSVPRLPSISRRAAAVAVGGCFAALVAVPLALDRSLLATDPQVARALVGVFGSLLALVVIALVGHGLLSGGLGADAGVGPLVDAPPERGGADEDAQVGAALRDGVDRAAHLQDEGVSSKAQDAVWKELRTAAALAEEHATGASTEAARERVAEGRWTDDAVVATFLAAPEAEVRYPARHVLYEWLTPGGAFEQRAERAGEAIRERYDAEGDAAVPDPERLPPVRPVAPGEAPDAATAVLGPELVDAAEAAAADGAVALPTTDEATLREGLRAAAVAAVDADSEPETDARATVRNGGWTDDQVAAAFLADAAAAVDRSPLDLFHGAIDPSGALDRRVGRTASAVLDRCESVSVEAEDESGDRTDDESDADVEDRSPDAVSAAPDYGDADSGDAATAASDAGNSEVAFRWSSDDDSEPTVQDVSVGKRR